MQWAQNGTQKILSEFQEALYCAGDGALAREVVESPSQEILKTHLHVRCAPGQHAVGLSRALGLYDLQRSLAASTIL